MTIDEEFVNKLIKGWSKDNLIDLNLISDGYHTFGELYEHRIILFRTVCKLVYERDGSTYGVKIWRSLRHSDFSEIPGWFIAGIDIKDGFQITYHIPIDKWDLFDFAETFDRAFKWDGHTSQDVLKRLENL